MEEVLIKPSVKACVFCGEEVLESAIKCKHCGEDIDNKTITEYLVSKEQGEKRQNKDNINISFNNDSPKSRGVALILVMLLGFLGIHRFYVGKVVSGLLYLFTGGFFFIGVVIDFLRILLGSFSDHQGKPLTKW